MTPWRTAIAALTLTLLALAAGCAPTPEGARIASATLVTDVAPDGLKVTGVVLEYDETLDLASTEVDPDAFSVTVDLSAADGAFTVDGDRTVLAAHTAATADLDAPAAEGRYLILALDPQDAAAPASYTDWDTSITSYYELVGGYAITQVDNLVAADGSVASRARHATTSSAVAHTLIDDYASGSLATDAGPTLDYRYAVPSTEPGETYPLVVTLHGFNESGSNNFSQLAGTQISVAFADPQRQAQDPAYVLSPQADPSDPAKGAWWDAPMQEAVVELVEEFITAHPDIDTSRVYLTGLSMGSYGSWGILTEHADLFAGAVLVCGGGVADEAITAAAVSDLPIWAVHSEDDAVVSYDADGSDFRIYQALESEGAPVTWTTWSGLLPAAEQEELARSAVTEAARAGSTHLFTTIEADTTPGFSHFSWIPTYGNDVILDWLFDQRAD
ncbi:alpha/beta hydrolase-fold protein [Demequina capsici]|uniref:PHB depolymerase family esterase n=1 Tax=Demequina capsici TaxID=3075620 RepID=A0AA96F7R7_9MICO|nr:PHB depolymerase family esterase [Demequina sp. OYTSA14]WNM25164.1 PHB depolymerase family esterase [Demequina sp. OYTSA14]